ncbi:hypothetical protein QBC37DRAFT_168426 [Rhypophila decipiens]|uniref:WSC domain-containing protein n=1 Tax=Rhypophila decipiens TaxID=261697 RepID=A0AAN7B814_9PEZI|nr:hypothetical protein QBC37DRAFT_168426 [Rhypophila decipiens]
MGPIKKCYHRSGFFIAFPFLLLAIIIFMSLPSTSSIAEASTITLQGCFYSPGSHVLFNNRHVFQSIGYCMRTCSNLEYDGSDTAESQVVALVNGTACFCGEPGTVPPLEDEIPLDKCNLPCRGFAMETCGGKGYFQVYTVDEDQKPECQVSGDL